MARNPDRRQRRGLRPGPRRLPCRGCGRRDL